MVGQHESLHDSPSTIMVAINGTKGSIFVLKWALNTFSSERKVNLMLFHVRQPITMIPTPMGNHIPISQVREDVVSAYQKDIESQTHTMILPYKLVCMRRKVDAEIEIKEAHDIAEGIAEGVAKFNISRLIIGASSRNMITRKLKGIKMSTKIAESTPRFCTVFVIRNGKLSTVRPGTDGSSKNERISDNSNCHSSVSCSDTLEKSLLPQNYSFQILSDDSTTDVKSVDSGSPCSILHRRSVSSYSVDDGRSLSCPTLEVQCSTSKMSSYRNYRVKVKSWDSDLSSLSNDSSGSSFPGNELEILSRIHHPHILMLLGACPERGCLVYEYMENGSLDDRLKCKNNTPPLPWHYRLRIAWEMASALVFLHSKPVPIVHCDIKPANILLNEKYVSKIGDAGISTLVPSMNFSMATLCKDTAPVGTFFYIDPEYQRTGMLSPKSDTYALGMVILELLTAKPPMGLAHSVEMALEDGNLMEVLDPKAGEWPIDPAQELAFLGISCLELRRKDRPDLKDHALPVLERLKEIAENAVVKPCFTT